MGRMVYWMNVSIDGYIERTAGEHTDDGPSWSRIDDQLHAHFNEQARRHVLMVEGRVVYEMMEAYWPAAATDTSLEPVLQEFGHIWTTMPKVLVSRTRASAGNNTRVVGGDDAMEQLAAIRAETDGAIAVGGATLATSLLRAGLLDELLLYVHPSVLGAGRPLFDQLDEPLSCELLETRDFPNGVTMRRYALQGAAPLEATGTAAGRVREEERA